MRPWAPIVLAFAAFAAAQNNVIDNGSNGIQAKAGEPLTLTWTQPSTGTVTIKIQTSGDVGPNDGIVLAKNVENTGSATFEVPADAPTGQIYIQIVDDANPNEQNFSGGFQVQGATNTATVAASTGSAAASSASESSAAESSAAESSASASASASAAATSSEASASASSASESEASASRSSSRTRSAASATAEETTAPTSGAATLPVVQGGLVAAMFGAVILL